MPISSVNSGFASSQAALNNVSAQRSPRQEVSVTAESNVAVPEHAVEAAAENPGTSAPLFNLVGVAAYNAIMNPQSSTSMRTEA